MVMGKEGLYEHDLVLYTDGYYDGYDPKLDPGTAQGFSSAAYRWLDNISDIYQQSDQWFASENI